MDDIVNQLTGILPPKYLSLLTALFVASQVIGRVLQAIRSGGGLRSIIRGIWFGTNTTTPKQELPKDEPTNNKLGLFLLCVLSVSVALGLTGCAGSYDRQVFRIEGAALGTADGAMRGYAVYYKAATNNPTAFKRSLADLNAERDRLCAYSIKVGASGEVVEQLRQSYKTNSAMRSALDASVVTLTANMTNILSAVTNVIHINPE